MPKVSSAGRFYHRIMMSHKHVGAIETVSSADRHDHHLV